MIFLVFLVFITDIANGQSEIEIELTIDTECNCPDSLILEPGSQFGIYAFTYVPKYSGNYKDTLISELDLLKEQKISLQQSTYKLIYTPADSTQQKSQYYFALNPYETVFHLNCLFFNKSYSFFRDQTHKNDTIIISSTYFGPTNEDTDITTHSLTIIRKKEKYFAAYSQSSYKASQLRIQIQPNVSTYPTDEPLLQLSKEQVLKLKELEGSFYKYSVNDNLNNYISSSNSVWINGKEISFYASSYVALLLWNELKKVEVGQD